MKLLIQFNKTLKLRSVLRIINALISLSAALLSIYASILIIGAANRTTSNSENNNASQETEINPSEKVTRYNNQDYQKIIIQHTDTIQQKKKIRQNKSINHNRKKNRNIVADKGSCTEKFEKHFWSAIKGEAYDFSYLTNILNSDDNDYIDKVNIVMRHLDSTLEFFINKTSLTRDDLIEQTQSIKSIIRQRRVFYNLIRSTKYHKDNKNKIIAFNKQSDKITKQYGKNVL